MTDNDIKKALGCCANCESCDFETTDCPLGEEMECRSLLAEHALDLINRLESENIRLQKCVDFLKGEACRRESRYDPEEEIENLLKKFVDGIGLSDCTGCEYINDDGGYCYDCYNCNKKYVKGGGDG